MLKEEGHERSWVVVTLCVLLWAQTGHAGVIRHDVDDSL